MSLDRRLAESVSAAQISSIPPLPGPSFSPGVLSTEDVTGEEVSGEEVSWEGIGGVETNGDTVSRKDQTLISMASR
jgi:hypothetical protein